MAGRHIYRGNFICAPSPGEIQICPGYFAVVSGGVLEGLYENRPEDTIGLPMEDFGGNLVLPGFSDLHVHAGQWDQRGLGMDLPLLPWLEQYTFPQEEKFTDLAYAEDAYSRFLDALVRAGTLRAAIFATIHGPAVELLFALTEKRGIKAFIGKVNMDQNAPQKLIEGTEDSLRDTERILNRYGAGSRVRPILTPRFVPTCSERLLHGLGILAAKYGVPVQSHLGENEAELRWVAELHPNLPHYAGVYDEFGLFGQTPTLMAHCIHLKPAERDLMKARNVMAVHCPESNCNLGNAIMPYRRWLQEGLFVALGSDVGAGHSLSMTAVMTRAVQLANLYALRHGSDHALSFSEVFYAATKGGGQFFGRTGSFEPGFAFDAIVVRDDAAVPRSSLPAAEHLKRRLQKFVYCGTNDQIIRCFVDGSELV